MPRRTHPGADDDVDLEKSSTYQDIDDAEDDTDTPLLHNDDSDSQDSLLAYPPNSRSPPKSLPRPLSPLSRRRRRCAIPIAVGAFFCFMLGVTVFSNTDAKDQIIGLKDKIIDKVTGVEHSVLDSDGWDLSGDVVKMVGVKEKTRKFRDALLPDRRYVTSFGWGGWTNEVMGMINTIYLAKATSRIPIISPFAPQHSKFHLNSSKVVQANQEVKLMLFSDVFDVPHLSAKLGFPVLDWRDVKDTQEREGEGKGDVGGGEGKGALREYYGGEKEEVGCWSMWMSTMPLDPGGVRAGVFPEALNLSISWTPLPRSHILPVNVTPSNPNRDAPDYSLDFIASLSNDPRAHADAIVLAKSNFTTEIRESVGEKHANSSLLPTEVPLRNTYGHQWDPDQELMCLDYTFFMSRKVFGEYFTPEWPTWQEVGRHMKWSETVLSLTNELLAKTLYPDTPATNTTSTTSTTSSSKVYRPQTDRKTGLLHIPPFISVHIRRGDFSWWCEKGMTRADCLAPLSAYEKRVKEVRGELSRYIGEKKAEEMKVVLVTDEYHVTPASLVSWGPDNVPMYAPGECEAFWARFSELGWYNVDHALFRTEEKYGVWYTDLVDAALLSLGSGFVGTELSTYSLIAMRRVEEWTGRRGVGKMVRWGKPGADDEPE